MRHFRVVRRVRKAAEVINHTDRADRVPNADKVDGARPCESSLKLSAGFSTWTVRPKIALPVIEGIRQETLRMRVKQADRMEDGGDSPSRVCPATKSKEKDLVAWLVIDDQEFVSVRYVVEETVSSSQSIQHRQAFTNFRFFPRLRHGADTGIIIGYLLRITASYLVGSDYVGVIAVELIVRSIATNNDVLWHEGPLKPILLFDHLDRCQCRSHFTIIKCPVAQTIECQRFRIT